MQGKYFILLPFCCLFFITPGFTQTNHHSATFFSHIKLKRIPTTVGMTFLVRPFCTTQADSILHADRYFFENATIGKIKSCKLDYTVRNDTIQSIIIYLTGEKNFNAAMKQAQKDLGSSTLSQNENEEIFTWPARNEQMQLSVSLRRKNKEWGSEMQIFQSGDDRIPHL